MRAPAALLLIIAAIVAAPGGEARADDMLAECADRAGKWLAANPGLTAKPDDETRVVIVSPDRVVFVCQGIEGLADQLIAARRDRGTWAVVKLGEASCSKLAVSRGDVLVEHTDSCPARYYHPSPCVDFRSRIRFGKKRGATLKQLSKKTRPVCKLCPGLDGAGCLRKARRAARALYKAGKVKAAARMLRGALDHFEAGLINSDDPRVDPWAINDALFYSARARIRCADLADTWADLASVTTRSRKALIANRRRCRRLEPPAK